MKKPETNIRAFLKALPHLQPLQNHCMALLAKKFDVPQSTILTFCDLYKKTINK